MVNDPRDKAHAHDQQQPASRDDDAHKPEQPPAICGESMMTGEWVVMPDDDSPDRGLPPTASEEEN